MTEIPRTLRRSPGEMFRPVPPARTTFVRGAAVGWALLAWVGCSDGGVGPGEGGDPPGESVALGLEVVTDAVSSPVYLTQPPGDDRRLFILEKQGRIRVMVDGQLRQTPFLDLAAETADDGERGLLGLAFHPRYAENGLLFVHHTDLNGNTRIVRYTAASPDQADPASATTILTVEQPFSNHNGGQLAFGPEGLLHIGLGDGGSAGDPGGNGQDPTTLLGAILRIDVDGGSPYAIPADNPFVGGGGAPEVWAYGLRNPWRFSFDRSKGDLWVGDVGQNEVEEISFQPAGSVAGTNFGWNVMEGTRCFQASSCDQTGLTLPVHEYAHTDGCSVTGGFVYRGAALPSLRGRYFFGDFCSGFIRSFVLEDDVATDVRDHSEHLGTVGSLSSFGQDGDGELYVLSLAGVVYRLVASE